MSTDKEPPRKGWSERISELGPAWITAIAALFAVFVGGGYVAGHTSGARDPAPQPTVTVTATATATETSLATSSPQSPRASQVTTSDNAQLGSYEIVLPPGYSIPLGASKPTQSQFDSTEQSGDLDDTGAGNENDTYQELSGDRMVQLPDNSKLTYNACTSSTAFTGRISGDRLGIAFCILENGRIAGV